ncbi:MAG: restriction endonuclease [Lewinellaceae bacterium]|nr:restriction endonuclease [Phaeodactylibacter sp.]MCB9039681.1 restriction endonuclease [Lewinellaceae bacterium]
MPTEDKYKQRIASFDWEQLNGLWQNIGERETPDWGSGKAFEYLILRSFELSGSEVVYPFEVSLFNETVEQIDGVVYFNHQAFIVECKDYNEERRVNFEPIAKLRNQLFRRPYSTIGCIFSNSGFTEPAIILANAISPQNIILWEREEIEECLTNKNMSAGLVKKFKKLIELGIADYNITSEGL